MILNADQLGRIAGLRRGQLSETPFAVLLQAFFVHRKSAVLEVRRGQLQKRIVLEEGAPVDCRSNLIHETLGRFMAAQGKLTHEECTRYVNLSLRRGVPLGEVLLQESRITATELFKCLQQNLAKKLLDCFLWRDGRFRVLPPAEEVQSPLQVRTPQLILTGITRIVPQTEVDRAVAPLVASRLTLRRTVLVRAEQLNLSPEQSQVVDRLERLETASMDELAAQSELPLEEFARLLYALTLMGMIVPEGAVVSGVSVQVAATRRRDEISSLPPADPEDAEYEHLREEVMQAFLDYRRLDPFDLLGVSEDAGENEIRDLYVQFARKYAPWEFEAPSLEPLAEKARELFLAGAAAYAELLDPEQRNRLIRQRQRRREQGERSPREVEQMKARLLDPEIQYQKGRVLAESGRYGEAVKFLELASEYDPQNALYRAELAYCWFHFDPASTAPQVLEQLRQATRLDPGCGEALYYMGEVYRRMKKPDQAEICFRKAIKLMAPDRRPIEALKVLSAESKEK